MLLSLEVQHAATATVSNESSELDLKLQSVSKQIETLTEHLSALARNKMDKEEITCFYCQQTEHMKRYCPKQQQATAKKCLECGRSVADPGFGRGGGHNGRCGYRLGRVVGGAAPGRVLEGGTPPAQLGGMGERCKYPIGVWGSAPEALRFGIKILYSIYNDEVYIELDVHNIKIYVYCFNHYFLLIIIQEECKLHSALLCTCKHVKQTHKCCIKHFYCQLNYHSR